MSQPFARLNPSFTFRGCLGILRPGDCRHLGVSEELAVGLEVPRVTSHEPLRHRQTKTCDDLLDSAMHAARRQAE